MNHCAHCIYHAVTDGMITCDYILITGHRRPCPPGKLCTVRLTKEGEKMTKINIDIKQVRRLIDEGKTIEEIASALNVSRSTVDRFLHQHGLSTKKRARPVPEGPGEGDPAGDAQAEQTVGTEREWPEPDCVSDNQSWLVLRLIRESLRACGTCLYTIGELMEMLPGGSGKEEKDGTTDNAQC